LANVHIPTWRRMGEHFCWFSVERAAQIARKTGAVECSSNLETRMQWTGSLIRTGTLPSKRGKRE
jgi:hypothetical protein